MHRLTLCAVVVCLGACGTNPLTPDYVEGTSMEVTRVLCSQGNVSFLGTLLPFMGKVDSVAIVQTPGAKQKVKSAKITSDGACGAEFENDESEAEPVIDSAIRQ